MTITVKGPDGSSFAFPDGTPEGEITGAMSKHYGGGEAAADPVTTNKVVRAAATGVPLVGGVLNQLNAATNATLAPVLNPLFDEKDQLKGDWAARRAESLRLQNAGDKKFEEAHPVIDTAAKVTGGVAGSIPAMMAAPAAFGLTGTLPQMVARGAVSNAALGGADAAIRGEDPGTAAAIGGAVGAGAPLVARTVGHLARGIKEFRNPTPPVAQNVERVAGVDVPLTGGQVAADPALQAEEEIMRRGGRGTSAEAVARQADDEAQRAVAEASGNIGRSLDPRSAPAAADANPVPAQFRAGTKDDTGPWFLGSDKPIYANATRDSLDRLYGPQTAAQFDQFAHVTGENANGNPITVWYKPGQRDRALREIENFKSKAGASPADEARLHYESGLNLGYPEPAARAYVEKRFGDGVLGQPSTRTAPQAAGEVVQSELAAQAAARETAAQQTALRVAAEGESLSRDLGGGAAPVSPLDAGERIGAGVAGRRDAKVAATQAAYKARDAVEGTFDESVPRGLAEDIRTRLNTGENPIWVDPTNESTANKALKLIDQTIGKDSGVFQNAAGPKAPPAAAAPPPRKLTEDETVAALRAKFGDTVADAYAKQNPPAAPLSLLEFIASKGGLAPHAELDAIGMNHGHRSQIPGQSGFFGTVRKNGSDIDRMREAVEEAGYLRGAHGETSTPTQLLDAIDAELRGQKLYPEGHAGFQNKRATAAAASRDTAERDAVMQGAERDLADAGYGEMDPGIRRRAAELMHDEGLGADDAVDQVMRHLEQEDAARAGAHAFPGDKPMAGAAPAGAAEPRPVDLKAMDEARKRLVTMYGDAKSAAIRSGDKSDMRAMGKILHEFDNSISDALGSGKFSGDAALAQELQAAARKSHAEYRQTFSSRGPGDETGRAVEKILGRYSDSAATPDEIAVLAYGSKSDPGGGKAVRIGLRLKEILGDGSAEWKDYKQGLFAHITQTGEGEAARTPAQIADRIDKFLTGRGSGLAKVAFDGKERSQLAAYAKSLRTAEPAAGPVNEVERAVARIAGTDGHLPASPVEVADMLFSRSGKGDKGLSVRLALRLKNDLKPESWSAVRQGMWEKLTNAGEGKIEFGPQALSQRLHEFLNESGKPLARVLFSKAEREEMAKLASVYKRMTPLKGTTNPSGTAPMLAKIAKKAGDNVLALIGLGAHGVSGAIIGHAVQRGAEGLKDARAGKEAVRLFFGPQARRPVVSGRLPQLVGVPGVEASRR